MAEPANTPNTDSAGTAVSAPAGTAGQASSGARESAAQQARANRNSVWCAKPLFGWLRRRTVYRAVVTVLLLGLVGLFGWLVFRPLYHPNARAAFMSGVDYHVLRAPPATFALEDANGLRPLARVLVSRGSGSAPALLSSLSNPAAMRTLTADLTDLTPEHTGVLIVYVDAHGVSDDGTAYLLCRNFDPANPSAGRVSLAEFLKQVSETPAAVKLILLDAGRIPSDPRLGMLVNEFPRLLEREVQRTSDANLWVLSANAAFQRSHVSRPLERSVFGFFAARGLQGAADLNQDHVVDLNELYRYVAANTAAWVREATGGEELQTPVLLWGGGADVTQAQWPTLLPVGGSSQSSSQAPASSAAFGKLPPGAVSSPYAQQAQSEFAPITNKAGYDATKKIPGARATKKTLKAKKKVSRRVERAKEETKEKKGAAGHDEATGPTGEQPSGTSSTEKPGDSKAAPGTAPSAASPDKSAEKAASTATTAPPAAGKEKESPPASPPTPADRLAEAWQLRDALLAVGDQPRPIDYAPQLWREFEAWLLGEEQLYRAGGVSDPDEIADTLKSLLPRLAKLPTVPASNAPGQPDLAAQFGEVVPHVPAEIDDVTSLALAQLIATRGGPALSAEEKAAADTLDRLARDGGPAELTAWIAKLNPQLNQFAEVRLARQLAGLGHADWSTVQAALAAELAGQRAAGGDPALLPWIDGQLDKADALRRAGKRALLDSLGGDRQAQAAVWLRQALDLYDQATDDVSAVAFAEQLEHELLDRAPYYVASLRPTAANPSPDAPKSTDVATFLDHLKQLAALLESPDPAKLEQVRNLSAELTDSADQLDAPWSAANVSLLTGRAAPAGRIGRLESLLGTPLADADARDQLLAGLADADAHLADTYHEATIPDLLENPPPPAPAQWRSALQRAELELALAKLAVGQDAHGQQLTQPLEDACTALRSALDSGGSPADSLWTAVEQFGAAARDFYRALPGEIEAAVHQPSDLADPATRPARLAALHRATRIARLLDARDVRQLGGANPGGLLATAAWHDLLAFQAQREQAALADAPVADVNFLTEAARAYRAEANEIADQPNLPPPSVPPVQLTGPTAVRLTTEPEQTLDFVVRSTVAAATDVWLVVDYDPALVELEIPPAPPIYRQPLWAAEHPQTGDAAAMAESPRPDRAGLPVSLQLRAGESYPLRLKIRARPAARDATRLILKAITADAYMRFDMEVILPPPQALKLVVEAQTGTWTESDSRLLLEPFPNRQTAYRLALVNQGITDRTVDVDVLAPSEQPLAPPPATALSSDDATAVVARFGTTVPVTTLTKIVVPTGGRAVPLPFPKPAGAAGAEKPKEAGAEEKGAEGKGAEAAAAPSPPPMSLDHGLLLVVTDRQTGLKTVHWLDVAPQRPRRYVHSQVSYNLDRGTVEIVVRAADKSLVPPEGVAVHAELSPRPQGAQSQLDGRLVAPNYEAALSAETTAEAGTMITVRLTVDGYPRAFIYRLPAGVQASNVPEATDLRSVRILAPEPGKAYKAPVESIPVDCEVDAPPGSFQDPDDVLEVGIDVDRARDLRHGPSVRLKNDREVHVGLVGLLPGGLLTLATQVGDFHLIVPAPGLRNARVDVLGRLFAGGKTGWSDPVEIILDGSPPRVERIELSPPIVMVGKTEQVSIWATDDQLSGVAKVEAAFDPTGSGKFGGAVPANPLERESSGRWFGKLPADGLPAGEVTLLVRATDNVGNVSDYAKFKCKVVTAEESVAAGSAQAVRVLGTVYYGADPAPQAKLTLTGGDKAAAAGSATSDDHGNFTFPAVLPGKYKLSAKALIHNKNRTAEQDITIEPNQTNPKPLKLVIK